MYCWWNSTWRTERHHQGNLLWSECWHPLVICMLKSFVPNVMVLRGGALGRIILLFFSTALWKRLYFLHFMDEGTGQGHTVSKWPSQNSNSNWLQSLKSHFWDKIFPWKWPQPTYSCFSLYLNQHSAPISPFCSFSPGDTLNLASILLLWTP